MTDESLYATGTAVTDSGDEERSYPVKECAPSLRCNNFEADTQTIAEKSSRHSWLRTAYLVETEVMDDTHLERLRKFALTAGLLLITYVAAGITVEPHTRVTAFGVPFFLSRPNLLPAGLALASLCGAARFYYYGLMLATSPRRKRRDLIDGLTLHADEYGKPVKGGILTSGRQISMYWGPRKFNTSPWHFDRELVEKRAAVFDNTFPKFAGARASARVVTETFTDYDGETHPGYSVEVVIPLRCRAAGIFEDLDYTAPVWLNALALLLFVWPLARRI